MTDTRDIAAALLDREPLSFTPEMSLRLSDYWQGKTILITGGGGSIGSEMVRTLSRLPCRIVVYDRSETNLTRIMSEGKSSSNPNKQVWGARVVPFLGDISQSTLLDHAFRLYNPDVVIHAAAYKHLPLLETFPLQAVENNVMGTLNVLSAAIRHDVRKFILISSDKACNSSSVMGATKRLAELMALNPYHGAILSAYGRRSHRCPIVVRLGNVLGSSGSVLPLFESQIASGGPITVTHPDATRFFMSIPEAANLILTAAVIGQGRETFVLDMGKPVNIADMARRLADIRGREDIEIKFTGMRSGEKLTEQLYTGITAPTAHPLIWEIKNENKDDLDWHKFNLEWRHLKKAVERLQPDHVIGCLRMLVPEYKQAHMTEANTHA